MQDLTVSIIQTPLFWEDKKKNIDLFSSKISSLTGEPDLIVLPEMFTTGFSMKPELFAEEMNGASLEQMSVWASQKNCVITGSIIVKDNNDYFNRLLWVRPDGSYEQYDKRHLFRFAGEDKHYTSGTKKLIVELKGWRICPLICFDLRFPVWSRNKLVKNLKSKGESSITETSHLYDCLIYVANWPSARSKAWSTLLEARAHENQCYAIGVNRIGNDGNSISHSGNSAIIEPKGTVITNIDPNVESIETVSLSWDELNNYRKKFPIAKDADDFKITTLY